MTASFINRPQGFNFGLTKITSIGEPIKDTGINFSILKLREGEQYSIETNLETAVLLISGVVNFEYDEGSYSASRSSVFDDAPIAIHFSRFKKIEITALSDCEFSISQVENHRDFETVVFDISNILENEHRGKGILNNTAYRIVRTIFDIRNRKEANLVLGEVVNFPGCWSSYPPHHHKQPEIYHYRFTEPQGYGHAELGGEIYKAGNYSTMKILDKATHSQVAAPGYGMYYIWVIRHLPGEPYTIPVFEKQHEWTRTQDANSKVWQAEDLKVSTELELEGI